jgi:hypothetical protein
MATKFRGVRGGTPFGEPLCRTCRYAQYIRGAGETQTALYCQMIRTGGPDGNPTSLKYEAIECSMYDDKRLPALHELKQVAWVLRTTLSSPIGFVPPQEWRNRWRKVDTGEDYD